MATEKNSPRPTDDSNEIEQESTTEMETGTPAETPEEKLERIAAEHGVSTEGSPQEAKDAHTDAREDRPDVRGGDTKTGDQDPEPPD